MTYRVDLHTHSTASDGQYSPSALVRMAKAAGLDCLAVTDHDTLSGLDEALQAGNACGLRVVRGVELGAQENRCLHILGYGFQPVDSPLAALCAEMRRGRDERKYRIVDFLREKGVEVTLAEVEALSGGEIIGRPHFAQALVRRGFVASTREAFDRYLDTAEYQRIERFKADARACVQTIKSSGGKAALAHPYQLALPDDALEKLVRDLKNAGLDALECHYPRHTPAQVRQYLALAKKYALHVSGGSDFHGELVKPDIALAQIELDIGWLLYGS